MYRRTKCIWPWALAAWLLLLSVPAAWSAPDSVDDELHFVEKWLNAWELVASEVFDLPESPAPYMLFYDSVYVYTNSPVSAPEGIPVEGPSFFGTELSWRKTEHEGMIKLPDGNAVPVQLMSFAGPMPGDSIESFFVMAAPAFWATAGVQSDDVPLADLITGVFLHEFSHTRQMNGIGRIVTEYEMSDAFAFPVSDDMIQEYLEADTACSHLFRAETEAFYNAAFADNEAEARSEAARGLAILKQRQIACLLPEKESLVDLDNVFLSMEGTGQFAMMAWLAHPEGGGVDQETAVQAARRNKNWWSQEEGLALFMALDRLTDIRWGEDMFSENPADAVTLLEKALNSTPNMFAVIYSFEVKPGLDEQFRESWRGLTELIYQYEGSLGSRLHHAGGPLYIAYAQWPDRATWENSGEHLPDAADAFRKRMKASCSEIRTLYPLEMTDDLLKDSIYR